MQKTVVPSSTAVGTYIPFGGRKDIGQEAARPRPEHITLSWACGLKAQRPSVKDGKQVIDEISGEVVMENVLYAGFFCDIGEDEDLDAAMEAVNTPKITISHQEGPAEHWALQRCALYLLAEGLQSKTTMKNSTLRMGVAYGWRTNKAGREESYFYAQVLPRQLLPYYQKPMILSIKGTQTEDALKLFYKQFEVLAFAHEVLRSQGADMALPLWAYALPAGPAKKTVSRGQTGKTSDIFPMVPLVAAQLTTEHLKQFEAPVEYLDILFELSAQSVAWSTDLATRIAAESDPFAMEPGAGGGR